MKITERASIKIGECISIIYPVIFKVNHVLRKVYISLLSSAACITFSLFVVICLDSLTDVVKKKKKYSEIEVNNISFGYVLVYSITEMENTHTQNIPIRESIHIIDG